MWSHVSLRWRICSKRARSRLRQLSCIKEPWLARPLKAGDGYTGRSKKVGGVGLGRPLRADGGYVERDV